MSDEDRRILEVIGKALRLAQEDLRKLEDTQVMMKMGNLLNCTIDSMEYAAKK